MYSKDGYGRMGQKICCWGSWEVPAWRERTGIAWMAWRRTDRVKGKFPWPVPRGHSAAL